MANKKQQRKIPDNIVYICSKYRGKTRIEQDFNLVMAKRYGRFAMEKGYVPIITHMNIAELTNDHDQNDRDFGIQASLTLLKVCSQIWIFGQDVSDGMRLEAQEAIREHIPIRWFSTTSSNDMIVEYDTPADLLSKDIIIEYDDPIVAQLINKYLLPIPPRLG